jgi:hypothetical protein
VHRNSFKQGNAQILKQFKTPSRKNTDTKNEGEVQDETQNMVLAAENMTAAFGAVAFDESPLKCADNESAEDDSPDRKNANSGSAKRSKETNSEDQEKELAKKRRERRKKARKLKKVLRERLNIDRLHMLSYNDAGSSDGEDEA